MDCLNDRDSHGEPKGDSWRPNKWASKGPGKPIDGYVDVVHSRSATHWPDTASPGAYYIKKATGYTKRRTTRYKAKGKKDKSQASMQLSPQNIYNYMYTRFHAYTFVKSIRERTKRPGPKCRRTELKQKKTRRSIKGDGPVAFASNLHTTCYGHRGVV